MLIDNVGELATLSSTVSGPRYGRDMDNIAGVKNGMVAVTADRILAAGPEEEVASRFKPGPKTSGSTPRAALFLLDWWMPTRILCSPVPVRTNSS